MKNNKLINYTAITNMLIKRSQGYRRNNAPPEIIHVLKVLDKLLEKWLIWAKSYLNKINRNKYDK